MERSVEAIVVRSSSLVASPGASIRATGDVALVGTGMHQSQESFPDFVHFALTDLVRGEGDQSVVASFGLDPEGDRADRSYISPRAVSSLSRLKSLSEIPVCLSEDVVW